MEQFYSWDWHVMLMLSQVTVAVNACSRGSQPGRGRQPPSENSPPMHVLSTWRGFKFQTGTERMQFERVIVIIG